MSNIVTLLRLLEGRRKPDVNIDLDNLLTTAQKTTLVDLIDKVDFGNTYTVGTGGDFTTLQAAIDAFDVFLNTTFTLLNSVSEQITISNKLGKLTIQGDIRGIAGCTYVSGAYITNTRSGAGAGIVTLSNSGNDITIAGSVTNPTFTELVAGDKLQVFNSSGSHSEKEVASVSGNVITLTTAAPTLGSDVSSVTFRPNKSLTYNNGLVLYAEKSNLDLVLDGLFLYKSGAGENDCITLYNIKSATFNHCLLRNEAVYTSARHGMYAVKSDIFWDSTSTIWSGPESGITLSGGSFVVNNGTHFISDAIESTRFHLQPFDSFASLKTTVFTHGGSMALHLRGSNAELGSASLNQGCRILKVNSTSTTYGIVVADSSSLIQRGSGPTYIYGSGLTDYGLWIARASACLGVFVIDDCGTGYRSTENSCAYVDGSTARNCTLGYSASNAGFIRANSTNANNSGNTTNYSPATSGAEGNTDGIIVWS